METLKIRLPNVLGCTVISTAVLQSLREKFPASRIEAYTRFPDLLEGLKEVDGVLDPDNKKDDTYDIDLENYSQKRKPATSMPLRHLHIHMIEIAEESLGCKLNKNFHPKLNFTHLEEEKARDTVRTLAKGKPIIWLQTKSRNPARQMSSEFWENLISQSGNIWTYIDLFEGRYTNREHIIITKYCNAGVTIDSFLLHGSKAVNARNVIAVLAATPREVVTYKNQLVFGGPGKEKVKSDSVVEELKKIIKCGR